MVPQRRKAEASAAGFCDHVQMRPGALSIRVLAMWIASIGLAAMAGAVQGQPRYEDGTPSGVPPGFEPVDISEDMHRIESRRNREIQRDAQRDLDYRHVTPERRIRARYGGATWNMYDPFH